jgi:hypothetical protein
MLVMPRSGGGCFDSHVVSFQFVVSIISYRSWCLSRGSFDGVQKGETGSGRNDVSPRSDEVELFIVLVAHVVTSSKSCSWQFPARICMVMLWSCSANLLLLTVTHLCLTCPLTECDVPVGIELLYRWNGRQTSSLLDAKPFCQHQFALSSALRFQTAKGSRVERPIGFSYAPLAASSLDLRPTTATWLEVRVAALCDRLRCNLRGILHRMRGA